jgi:hypothetical protein
MDANVEADHRPGWGANGCEQMTPNDTVFRWDARREEAADLVAGDWLTDRAIAAKLGIHVATLERWKQRREFKARVDEHVSAYRERLMREVLVCGRAGRSAPKRRPALAEPRTPG